MDFFTGAILLLGCMVYILLKWSLEQPKKPINPEDKDTPSF
jgi:hypothetical protein